LLVVKELETREPQPPAPFDGRTLARALLTEATFATLGTLDDTGAPFATLVALARDTDLRPLLLTSHLSHHTQHLERDPRLSLLISRIGKGDPLAHPRLTLTGKAVQFRPGDAEYERLRPLYLAQHKKAELYVDLPGFWLWQIAPDRLALNGGFGKAWTGSWSALAEA
jgi:heme iron utilization protein